MRYFNLRQRPKQFQSFTGLKVEEFDRLAALLKSSWQEHRLARLAAANPDRQRKLGGGRKKILNTFEDQLLLTLIWTKLYLVLFVLEHLFGADESTIYRTIQEILPILQTQFIFEDPRQSGRKKIRTLEELRKALPDVDLDDLLADGTEQPIPRPEAKRNRNKHHSGKKKRFTVKTQIATTRSGLVVHVSQSVPGSMHDFKLFKRSWLPQIIPKTSKLYLDSGYQGIRKDFPDLNSVLPYKRTRNHQELTRSEKIQNTKQRRIRVMVENTLSKLKKYACLSSIYRHSLQNYNPTFKFVANVVNFRTLQRLQTV